MIDSGGSGGGIGDDKFGGGGGGGGCENDEREGDEEESDEKIYAFFYVPEVDTMKSILFFDPKRSCRFVKSLEEQDREALVCNTLRQFVAQARSQGVTVRAMLIFKIIPWKPNWSVSKKS